MKFLGFKQVEISFQSIEMVKHEFSHIYEHLIGQKMFLTS